MSLARGFLWNTGAQIATVLTAVLLTPFIIARLGVADYGLYTLASLALALLLNIDGGLLNSAGRFFGIAAGAGDRTALSNHFATLTVLLGLGTSGVGAVIFVFAPHIAHVAHLVPGQAPAAIYATRAVAILLPLGAMQGICTAVLQVHGRYAVVGFWTILTRLSYVAAVVAFLGHTRGVQTVMLLNVAQTAVLLAALLGFALRELMFSGLRLLPRREIVAILRFTARVQVSSIGAIINLQLDGVIVGAVLPVRDVAFYGTGALIASQVRTIPLNASPPIITRLSRTFGAQGERATRAEFVRLQALWSVVLTGFASVFLGASVFMLEAWLGHRFVPAGIVCAILTFSNLINLLTAVMTVYLNTIGRPDIEVRYGVVSTAFNVVLTVALVWTGLYGIVAATAVGQVLGSLLLVRFARRGADPTLESFVLPATILPGLLAAVVAGAVALGLHQLISVHGAGPLVLVSLSVVPGALAYVIVLLGPGRTLAGMRDTLSTRSPKRLLQGMVEAAGTGAHPGGVIGAPSD